MDKCEREILWQSFYEDFNGDEDEFEDYYGGGAIQQLIDEDGIPDKEY